LTASLSIENFASQVVERHNVPEVEARKTIEALLTPLVISRNASERVLVEPSINSVRISIKIKQADEIETILAHKVNTGAFMVLSSSCLCLAKVYALLDDASRELCHPSTASDQRLRYLLLDHPQKRRRNDEAQTGRLCHSVC
jgi:hypothetical protein